MASRPAVLFMALAICVVAHFDDVAKCTNGDCEGLDAKGGAIMEVEVFKEILTWVKDVLQAFRNDRMSPSDFAGLSRSKLQDMAIRCGATKEEVDAALDADDSEAALVDLVLTKVPPKECSELCSSVRERWGAVKEAAGKIANGLRDVKESVNDKLRRMAENIAHASARGKEKRGADSEDNYQFGDFTRSTLCGLRKRTGQAEVQDKQTQNEDESGALRRLKWRWADHLVASIPVRRGYWEDTWNMPGSREALVEQMEKKVLGSTPSELLSKKYDTRRVEFADVEFPERRRTFDDYEKALGWLWLKSNIMGKTHSSDC